LSTPDAPALVPEVSRIHDIALDDEPNPRLWCLPLQREVRYLTLKGGVSTRLLTGTFWAGRGLKGPRTYEGTGMPFHRDNQTVVKERLFFDKTNPDALSDEITVIDHALTRPWTVTKRYRRDTDAIRLEYDCSEDNHHVLIGGQDYFLSGDNMLMPAKKGQAPPDLRYFKDVQK
jgi:hypothetical protein